MAEEKIYSAICAVMEDIGAVGKNDINKTQGFKYRGIDAVMNALSPAMVKHKVFCVPELLEQTRIRNPRRQKGGRRHRRRLRRKKSADRRWIPGKRRERAGKLPALSRSVG